MEDEDLEVVAEQVQQVITWHHLRVPRGPDTTTSHVHLCGDAGGAPRPWLRSRRADDGWLQDHTIRISASSVKFDRKPDPTLNFPKASARSVTE